MAEARLPPGPPVNQVGNVPIFVDFVAKTNISRYLPQFWSAKEQFPAEPSKRKGNHENGDTDFQGLRPNCGLF